MQFKYLTVFFAAWASLLGAASALPQPSKYPVVYYARSKFEVAN